MSYCTLFYSNYLDKGWCLAESLNSVDPNSILYILCMDERCFEILSELGLPNVQLIQLCQFEDEDLLKVKNSRSLAEYCWTCTAKLIKYVLCTYNEQICTYVDADMYFYSDPSVLIQEMKQKGCSVQVVPHRFPKSTRGKLQEKDSGRNCVQFNTFTKEEKSLNLLETWINLCLNECSYRIKGDQKYTDCWGDYSFVSICENKGAGVAPWNLTSYKLKNNEMYIRKGNQKCNLVFYHFENIVYLDRNTVKIEPPIQYWRMDYNLIKKLYIPYLIGLESKKDYIEKKYGISVMAKKYSCEKVGSKRRLLEILHNNTGSSLPVLIMKINDNIRRHVRGKYSLIHFNT